MIRNWKFVRARPVERIVIRVVLMYLRHCNRIYDPPNMKFLDVSSRVLLANRFQVGRPVKKYSLTKAGEFQTTIFVNQEVSEGDIVDKDTS